MATGTKLMKEISDQFLICKICLEPFKEPKTLSCLHTFCCACVQQQYDVESNRPTRYTLYARAVTCPVCRKKTELPTGGVRRLPDNFLVSNLTDVLAKRRCVSKVPPCEICHTVRSRSSDACSKCLDCDKLLCRACVDLHTTTKVTQDHSLIDLEGQKDIECKAHPEETVRFYCEKCEECICVVCTFQEHKDHDVCSFNDGFVKHKVLLEGLLGRSKERLTDVTKRLKVIEKYENLSKELKERIRDQAISYTSQVRAREKELIKKVDELFSGQMTQLAEKKAWLQENFDSLQSACNLTEIVVKDKGLEMLLLKKEIQGKMDHLLGGALPPQPPNLHQLDVQFVPGEVKLGDIFIPGSGDDQTVKEIEKNKMDVNSSSAQSLSSDRNESNQGILTASSQPCRECLKRKRQEGRERRRNEDDQTKEKRRKSARSVLIQTKVPETATGDGCFIPPASEDNTSSTGVDVSNNSIRTHTITVPCSGTDGVRRHIINGDKPGQRYNSRRARGTMTARQDVRTLKIQTEESCLRDTHLGHAAAAGSTYPNTGAAIAAAFLRQKTSEEEKLTRSWPMERREGEDHPFSSRPMHDAEVATDISLGVIGNTADTLSVLCQGETGTGLGVSGSDHRKPDLLAETGIVAVPTPSSSRWIRSRKVQTEISALNQQPAEEGQCFIDDDMKRALFVPAGSTSHSTSTTTMNKDTVSSSETSPLLSASRASLAGRPSSCDVGVMTSFKVKLVQDTADRDTITDAVTTHGIGMMTSLETRTVYIQTQMQRLRSTAAGTDYEGQMSKSTSTQFISSIDAETTMPQVLHENRTTWTDALLTSERATYTEGPEMSDAVTLTTQVQTNDLSIQMRPEGVEASTNTVTPAKIHHQSQAAPPLSSRGIMPDSIHLILPEPLQSSLSDSHSTDASPSLSDSEKPSVLLSSSLAAVSSVDADGGDSWRVYTGTETRPPRCVTIAVGPDSQMFSCRTTSTDTLHLLQVTEKETCTPSVKTVDDWTHTPQPQMINTGVTPFRPAVIEVGVATTPFTLMDQATYTEVKTFRDSGTEHGLVTCDSETLTEKSMSCDAQTGAEINTENQGTSMEVVERADGSCMTEKPEEPLPAKQTQDSECQCLTPALTNKEVNTKRFRRKAREAQTSFSYMECLLCQHPEKLERLTVAKTFTDTSTDPNPPDTHDVATMALSCLASPPGLVHTSVQTLATALYDKGVATSFEFEEDFQAKPFLELECQDAATSTESLPYIGLLSEIDVDELIVIPEANFELVSDSDDDTVSMVDGETLTEVFDYVEVGTQTILPMSGTVVSAEQNPLLFRPEDDCSKHLVSVGVNTTPKVTFEKETSTPIRHLFSKGTMTFFVAKMDKATSTISQTRPIEVRHRTVSSGAVRGRAVKEASRHRTMDSKVTMTNKAEQRDMAVETDSTLVDGRITQCISKLRNVSERLNSPTLRKTLEGELFFGQSFAAHRPKDSSSLASPTSPKFLSSPAMSPRDASVSLLSPPRVSCAEEARRQTQVHNLLAETEAVLKSKDLSSVRKAQPITTLKTRSPDAQGDVSHFASKSFPRPRSLDRQNKVKMGSQAASPCHLPLSRYNSAPGRIATVPAQTLLRKTGQTSPRTSPSRIPVSQKPIAVISSTATTDSVADSDTYSTSSSQKVQQRPSLPSISETRTPSSCSETSYISVESGESSLNPPSIMTSSHSRTPSNITSVSDTTSEVIQTKSFAETLSAEARESNGDDSISGCSTSTALMVTPTGKPNSSASTSSKQKKEKKGFMQRFLPGKKKKDVSTPDCEKEGASKPENTSESKPKPVTSSSPQVQKKQSAKSKTGQGTRPKNLQAAKSPSSTVSSTESPPPPVSISGPSSSEATRSSIKASVSPAAAASAEGPSLPPHHYPPLPDPNKTPPPPRKPRPFVYVRQRIFSIQQDNVEEVTERKEKEKEEKEKEEKEKEEKEKGKPKGTGQDKVTVNEQVKVKDTVKGKAKDEKIKDRSPCSVRAVSGSEKKIRGTVGQEAKAVEKGKRTETVRKAEKLTVSKPGIQEVKEKKEASKPRWVLGK